jgi:4-hydroxy-tetrahydrodipicolinate synthase
MNDRMNMEQGITTTENPYHPRVLTAMVTPFGPGGNLNHHAAQELAAYLVANGSDGLVLAGTTGESPTLLVEDQLDLFDVVREAVGPDVPLLGGTGSNNTEEAISLTKEATRRGSLNGILAVSPYYNRPPQSGIAHYYQQLRGVSDLPITLYNIPVRTGKLVELETISRLVDGGAVNSVKDATGTTSMVETLHERFGGDLALYSGDDSLNLAFARAGAVGAISVASHWAGRTIGRMFAAYFEGDNEQAEELETRLAPSCEFESVHEGEDGRLHDTPNPIPTKVMMTHILGAHVIGNCLPPMIATPADMDYLRQKAPWILADLDQT